MERERRHALTFNAGNPVTESVERVTVDGPDGPTSTIHKVIRARGGPGLGYPSGSSEHDLNYWRREALVYRSDLRDRLAPHGIELPRLIDEVDEGDRITLVLDDVAGTPGYEMDDDALVDLARRWGAAQAALAHRPPETWFGTEFLRRYLEHRPDQGGAFDDDAAWAHPAVAAAVDPALRAGLRRLWDDRWWCCDQSELLPNTLGHHDLWAGNVIFRPDGTPVVIDWAFCGTSTVGTDMVVMVLDTFLDLLVDIERLPGLATRMVDAWLDGVSASIDPEVAQLGMWLAAARFSWLPIRMIDALPDGPAPTPYQPDSVTVEQQWAARAPVFERMVEWHEAARSALGR